MEKEYDLALDISRKKGMLDFSSILDEEKLLRLHPHWFVNDLTTENHYATAQLKDHATDEIFFLSFSLVFDGDATMTLVFEGNALQKIAFFKQNGHLHARVISEDSEEKAHQAVAKYQIDLWLRGIREYVRLYMTTTINTLFFRFIMNRVILTMNPSQRKICLMIFRFTLLEVFVILLIVIGYFVFIQ